MQTKQGMVLLMVLAVLTLLCLLGLMFVLMANMERATARAYLDMVRAKMIAQSGIHAAMVNTRVLLTEKGFDIEEMEYRGEDLDGDGVLDPAKPSYPWENQDNDGELQTLACPLYRAVRPSFMVDLDRDGELDVDNNDDLINVQGKWVGLSGIMPGPYNQTIGAYYSVKVEDLSGKIFINGVEDPEEKEMLARVLGNLTYELFDNKTIGEILAQAAPYANVDEIKTKLEEKGIKLSEDELIRLKTCVTAYAWRDTGVIKPVPREERLGDAGGIPPLPGEDVFTWCSIRPLTIRYPSQSGRSIGRAPVNINTAPEPVLVALLKGLGGLYLDEDLYFTWYPDVHSHLIGFRYSFRPDELRKGVKGSLGIFSGTAEISSGQAHKIAQAIIQNRLFDPDDPATNLQNYPWRGTFRGWQQFGLFCDQVLWQRQDPDIVLPVLWTDAAGNGYFLTPQQADVLKANFNPNSNLTELNPPYQRLFWVGKDNLSLVKFVKDKYGIVRPQTTPGYSMEFSFFPSGYFLITALGRLLGPDNNVLSEAEIQATVQLFSLYRETSQKDFLEDFWKRGVQIDEVINTNTSGLQTTHDNLTLQTYPEILEYGSTGTRCCRDYINGTTADTEPGKGNPYVQDAHYDGYITLATVENRNSDPLPNFRASYNEYGLNADIPVDLECLRDDTDPYMRGPYQNRLVGPAKLLMGHERQTLKRYPGALFPDGIYSELDCVPVYNYRPSNPEAGLNIFTTSLWIKPHFFPESASKCRTWFTYQAYYVGGCLYCVNPIVPLGIYSIPGDTETNLCNGLQRFQDRWDNASFFAGGVSTREENRKFGGGPVSCCLNHIPHQCKVSPSHPSHASCGGKVTDPEGQEWGTLFRAGKWLHLGWVHHAWPTPIIWGLEMTEADKLSLADQIDRLYINGRKVAVLQDYYVSHGGMDVKPFQAFLDLQPPLRLGERRNQFKVPEDEVRLNAAPDGTIDEVLIWDGLTPAEQGADAVKNVWEQGRYYRGNDGVFTSRTINLAQEMKLPTGTPVTVFMVNWTQYVPEEKYTLAGNPVTLPLPGESGAPTCEIEILNGEVENPMSAEAIGVRKSTTLQPDPSGELIIDNYTRDKLVVTEPIRYRVKFLPKVNLLNDILVDPLIFDDITIIYYSVPKFLSWAYRR